MIRAAFGTRHLDHARLQPAHDLALALALAVVLVFTFAPVHVTDIGLLIGHFDFNRRIA
jgi:hypothetical protein